MDEKKPDGRRKNVPVINAERMLRTRRREDEVFRLLMQGVTRYKTLAAHIGVSEPTICRYVQRIMARLDNSPRGPKYRKRMLEWAVAQSYETYDRSKEAKQVTTIKRVYGICEQCKGSGFKEGSLDWCNTCNGEGTVAFDVEQTTRTENQAGDVSALGVAVAALREINKIEGNHEPTVVKAAVAHAHAHVHALAPDVQRLIDMPTEDIVQAMATIARLRAGQQQGHITVEEQR